MGIFIVGHGGAVDGVQIELKVGMTLGRVGCDVNLQDNKVSARHAKVVLDSLGNMILEDLGSSNALLFGGKRVVKVALKAGAEFKIGVSTFKVQEIDASADWNTSLQKLAATAKAQRSAKATPVTPFKPALRVEILPGEQVHILGYGPRHVGGGSVDLNIDDPDGPRILFSLAPGPDGAAKFQTDFEETVTFNGEHLTSSRISAGDVVIYRGTQFRFSFEGPSND